MSETISAVGQAGDCRAALRLAMTGVPRDAVERAFREDSRRVLATLIRLLGDFDVAEEALQDAFAAALVRRDLCREAIRLGRLLVELMPEEAEANALLALMLLHDSRGDTRVSSQGELLLLEEQDRSRWNREQIAEGVARVENSLRSGRAGKYAIQADRAAINMTTSEPERRYLEKRLQDVSIEALELRPCRH